MNHPNIVLCLPIVSRTFACAMVKFWRQSWPELACAGVSDMASSRVRSMCPLGDVTFLRRHRLGARHTSAASLADWALRNEARTPGARSAYGASMKRP